MDHLVLLVATLAAGALLIVAAVRLIPPKRKPISIDGQVIAQLARNGDDPPKPREIEFFLYLPTREAAEAAAKEIENDGFQAQISPAHENTDWLLFLTRSMRPVESDLIALREKLSALAARHGGEYDGWGCLVEPYD